MYWSRNSPGKPSSRSRSSLSSASARPSARVSASRKPPALVAARRRAAPRTTLAQRSVASRRRPTPARRAVATPARRPRRTLARRDPELGMWPGAASGVIASTTIVRRPARARSSAVTSSRSGPSRRRGRSLPPRSASADAGAARGRCAARPAAASAAAEQRLKRPRVRRPRRRAGSRAYRAPCPRKPPAAACRSASAIGISRTPVHGVGPPRARSGPSPDDVAVCDRLGPDQVEDTVRRRPARRAGAAGSEDRRRVLHRHRLHAVRAVAGHLDAARGQSLRSAVNPVARADDVGRPEHEGFAGPSGTRSAPAASFERKYRLVTRGAWP